METKKKRQRTSRTKDKYMLKTTEITFKLLLQSSEVPLEPASGAMAGLIVKGDELG